jgi:PleD family two-component response regulator
MKTGYAKTVESQLLQAGARSCLENIRGIDLLGRFDDDLLVILLPETNEEAARLVANRIKLFITGNPVETNRGPVQTLVDIRLVTSVQEDFQDLETMLKRLLEPFSSVRKSAEAVAIANSTFK